MSTLGQPSDKPRILMVDDDIELCQLVAEYLRVDGFEVSLEHDGEAGVAAALSGQFDVIILDVMMPKLNGFDALKAIHAEIDTPVLMLTARGNDIDRIVGLEIGADDYLAKPCNLRELTARLRVILRRVHRSQERPVEEMPQERRQADDLELHLSAKAVYRNGSAIELTATEFSMLELLVQSAGSVVSKDTLCRKALRRPLSPFDRSVDSHICNLRKKLGERQQGGHRIKTIRSQGYLYILE